MTKNQFQLLSNDDPPTFLHQDHELEVGFQHVQSETETLINPISLPIDVVSQVFYLACQPIPGDVEWRRDLYPLRLGCICRQWREVAWAMSELWQTVVLRVRPNTYGVQCDLLREWLERARGRPLDIYFAPRQRSSRQTRRRKFSRAQMRSSENPFNCIEWEVPAQIIQLLGQHSEQWRRIELHLPTSQWYNRFYRTTNSGGLSFTLILPILESISLHYSQPPKTDRNNKTPITVQMDFRLATSLRNMAFSSTVMVGRFFNVYPTTQITSLVLTDVGRIDLVLLLRRFPVLKEVEFTRTEFVVRESRIPPHDELGALTVKLMTDFEFFEFFDDVTFPELKRLSIYLPSSFENMSWFPVFFQRSGCSLTILFLECQIVDEENIIDLLDSLPSLVELHLCDYDDLSASTHVSTGIESIFFKSLHPDEDSSYLPNLEIFSYEGPLAAEAIDFLEPLIVRSRIRASVSQVSTNVDKMAILRSVIIKSDQDSEVAEFSIVEHEDPSYVSEVVFLIEKGVFTLINMDGSKWD